jgi:hypothetical protein
MDDRVTMRERTMLMAKFIEYGSRPWAIFFCVFGGVAAVPLLAELLLAQGVISGVGFIILVLLGLVATFLLVDRMQRRVHSAVNVAAGENLKQSQPCPQPGCRVFREDPGRRTAAILAAALVFVLAPVCLRGAYQAREFWGAAGILIAICPAIVLPGALWASVNRVQIEGDSVFVIFPRLAQFRNRAFRFGDIHTVEVQEVPKGGKEVRMILNNGRSARYMTSNEAEIDKLVEALKRGVAQAKPAPLETDELA